jgi:hypothetical protein
LFLDVLKFLLVTDSFSNNTQQNRKMESWIIGQR